MSGEELRALAQQGHHKFLSKQLKNTANPCSTDEYGITALMYAAWNGHVECVKYLVSNVHGIDKNEIKCSSLNMVTTRGYTGKFDINRIKYMTLLLLKIKKA